MATLDDAREYALSLPDTSVGSKYGNEAWMVNNKVFAMHRPLTKADIKRWGDDPLPTGDTLSVVTLDLDDKRAILSEGIKGFFTMQHFDNYPAFLIQLDIVTKRDLKRALKDAWLACSN